MSALLGGGTIWTVAQLDEDRAAAEAAIAGAAPEARLGLCLERAVDEHSGTLSRRFMFALKALELHGRDGGLSAVSFNRVVDLAKSLLRLGSVRPIKSKVSFLYRELHEAISLAYARDGQTWDAVWEYQLAQLLARKGISSGKGAPLVAMAHRCWRLGQGLLADKLLVRAEEEGVDAVSRRQAVLLRSRLFASAGRWTELAAALESLRATADEDEIAELEWLRLVSEVVRHDRTVEHLVRAVSVQGLGTRPGYALQAWLWTRITGSKEWAEKLPALKTIRGRFSEADRRSASLGGLWRCVQSLDQAYDAERPLDQRLQLAQRAMTDARRAVEVEHEVLVTAAVVRWLVHFNQVELAAATLLEYQKLSYGMSAGASLDVLDAFSDLEIDVLLRRYASKPAA